MNEEKNEVDVGALTRKILHTFVNKMHCRSDGGVRGGKGSRAKDE